MNKLDFSSNFMYHISKQFDMCLPLYKSQFHILPREVFGKSTFSVAMRLMKSFPVWMVDYFLVSYSRVVLGDTAAFGIQRPKIGPLELKAKMGKTPVLDVGTLDKIRSGDVKVDTIAHLFALNVKICLFP